MARSTSRAGKTRPRNRPARAFLLPADCTLAHAGELHFSLSKVLTQPATLILDASETRHIDTAGLQLLAAFIRDRRNNARPVSWKVMPPVIGTAAKRLGMQALLDPASPGDPLA